MPLVAQDGRLPQAIAEGALMRLAAEASCIRRYERDLGRQPVAAAFPPSRRSSVG